MPSAAEAPSFSYRDAHRPLPLRVANAAGRRFARASRRLFPLSLDSVVRAAERKTGVSADGDEAFREPLERLLESIEADGRPSPFGRFAVREQLVDLLSQRLRVNDHLERHPEILDLPIERPVFIIGFPRTGSTFLHNLMALDSATRAPKLWELMNPAPLGSANGREDPRIAEARDYVRELERMSPLSLKIHPMTAEGLEECRFPLERTFMGGQFIVYYRITRYIEWFNALPEDRLEAACLDVRRQMQAIKHPDSERRWVGKSTGHALFGRGLVRAFPDACVVQLLRDPVEAVPSICSLAAALRSIFSDDVDPRDMGPEALHMFGVAMDRNREMQTMPPPATFCEVRYEDLVTDPIGVVRRIYDAAGLAFTGELERRLELYVREHPQHAGGVHRYSPEQFGLTVERIRAETERHADWLEGFGR